MRRILSCVLLLCSLLLLFPLTAAAEATAVLGFSASTIQIGDTLTVTVKFSDTDSVGGVEATLSYDDSLLEFVSGNDANGAGGSVRIVGWSTQATAVQSLSYALTFKAKAAGSALIRVEESAVYSFDSKLVGNPTAGARVTITTKETLSGNADLSALRLSTGKLSPAFSPSVTSYSVSVPNNISSLTISATAADNKAKVAVSGNAALQVGSNKRVITVTAQNGATKTYTVVINRQKADTTTKPPVTTATVPPTTAGTTETTGTTSPANPDALYVELGDTTYRIADSLAGISLPEGWTVTDYRYYGNAIQAAEGPADGRLLFWLTDTADEEQNGAFFLYDTFTGQFHPYISVAVDGGRYLLLQPKEGDEAPAGCVAGTTDIGGQTMAVWRWEAEELADFCLIYAINPTGEAGLYRYDLVEGTLQRYAAAPSGTTTPGTTDAVGVMGTAVPTTASSGGARFFGVSVLWLPIAGLSLICLLLAVLLALTLRRYRPKPRH